MAIESSAIETLIETRNELAPLFPLELLSTTPFKFDFSEGNNDIKEIDMTKGDLEPYINDVLKTSGRAWGYGGWGENRFLYESSPLFKDGDGYRSIHLGIDIWLPAGTPLFAPLPGRIHSFQDNHNYLDYGPTIITEHTINDDTFYILYGHLSRPSLEGLTVGQTVSAGEQIATIGTPEENVGWPPHVHLQLIKNMCGKKGDFPGVATPAEKERYLDLCPNPGVLFERFVVNR